jgi:uracil-DNA glycosylase
MDMNPLCQRCGLAQYRDKSNYQIVWGDGNIGAKILLIGEAPGENEAKTGMPFVGVSGQFLRHRLAKYLDLKKDLYIINCVLCRPPDNRQPTPEEQEACFPHVLTVIFSMRPKLIMTAGKVSSELIAKLTGKPYEIYRVQGVQIFEYMFGWLPLYHPSYVKRSKEQTERFEKALESYRNLFRNIDKL